MQAIPYILRGVILPLVIGGLVAYLYPALQTYVKNPSSFRKARINKLRDQYETIRQYASDRSFLIPRLVFHLATLLGQLAVLILATTIHVESLFGNFLGLVLYGYIAASCLVQVNMIQSIIRNSTAFTSYREKTIAELKSLGDVSEDLDNKET